MLGKKGGQGWHSFTTVGRYCRDFSRIPADPPCAVNRMPAGEDHSGATCAPPKASRASLAIKRALLAIKQASLAIKRAWLKANRTGLEMT